MLIYRKYLTESKNSIKVVVGVGKRCGRRLGDSNRVFISAYRRIVYHP